MADFFRCRRFAVMAAALGVCLWANTLAAQPSVVPVQGVLTDDTGGRIDTASIAITLRIYQDEVGGTSLHTESQSVAVRDGVFVMPVGRDTPLDMEIFGIDGVWVSVQVAAFPEIEPRFPLSTAPYAAWASRAGTVTWASIENVPPAVASGGDYVSGPGVAINAAREVGLQGSACFPGEMWLWNGSAWGCGSATSAISGTAGVQVAGGVIAVDTTYAQRLIAAHDCPFGIASIGATGTVTCAADNNTNVNVFGRGCAGANQVVRGFDGAGQPICVTEQNTNAINRGCGAGQALRGFQANGTPVCISATATDTNVYGRGCTGANQVLRGFHSNGSPICVVDQNTNTNAFGRSCTGTNQVLRGFNSGGTAVCVTEQDTNTTYTASNGLIMSGTQLRFANRRVQSLNRASPRAFSNGAWARCSGSTEWLYGWRDDNGSGCGFLCITFRDWANCSQAQLSN